MGLMAGDLRTAVLEAPGVVDLVEDRVFAVRRQQGSDLPSIVVTLVSTDPKTKMAGYSNMRFRRVQVDIYAAEESGDHLDALGEALFDYFKNFSGDMGDTRVPRCHLLTERDLDEGEAKVLRRSQDWQFFERAQS